MRHENFLSNEMLHFRLSLDSWRCNADLHEAPALAQCTMDGYQSGGWCMYTVV